MDVSLIKVLLAYVALAAVSTVIHLLLAFFVGKASLPDWRLIRKYIESPNAVSERSLRQSLLVEIREIDGEIPQWRRVWLRAVSLGLPVIAICDIILLTVSPLGTTGFGLATLLELAAILFVHLPTTLMQFWWRGRRWLGVLWIVMAAAAYFLPFGQALALSPYHYLWNLLLPYRSILAGAVKEGLGGRNAARRQVGIECSVFVSYARKDEEVVMPDVELLRRAGCSVWYDRDIKPGEDWIPAISQHVVSADAVLVFVSPNLLQSDFVERELCTAITYKKRIIPVFIDPVPLPPDWVMRLGTVQAVDRYDLGRGEYEAVLLNRLRDWKAQG